MANQMIALQARGPQLPDAGALTARYANVMANMSAARQKQDEIARAAEFRRRAESGVDVLTPEGFNQIAGLDPEGAAALRKSALEKQKADAEFMLGYLGTVNEELQRANTPEQALAIGQSLKQAYPMFAGNIDQTLAKMPGDPAQFPAFRQQLNLSALKASERIGYELEKIKSKEIIGESGDVGVLTTGGLNAPTIKIPRTMIPDNRRGTVSVEPSVTIDENAPISAEDAESFIQSFPREAQAAIRQRVSQGALGNIPMGSPVAGGLVTGERGGVGGPDEGYIEAPMPFRAKNPSVSPYPGSAQVPLQRLGDEKRVEAQATKDVELAAEQTKKLAAKKQVSTILGKMRDAYEQLEKAEAIPSEKRGTFSNVLDYLGSSTLGREAQKLVGTEESKYLSRIVNMRKALATAIKNATGMSAQEMNSNVELQLTLDTLTDPTQGIEAARMALADLEEIYGAPKEAAPTGPRRTPVMPDIPRAAIDHLRKNPSLSAAFDAKYGKGQAAKVLGRR